MILLLFLLMQAAASPQKPPATAPTITCVPGKSDKPAIRNVGKDGKCPTGEKPLLGPDKKTVMSCLGKEHPRPVCTVAPAK